MKNEANVSFCKETPDLEKISTIRLAILTTWLGPAATWGSGAVIVEPASSRIPSIPIKVPGEGATNEAEPGGYIATERLRVSTVDGNKVNPTNVFVERMTRARVTSNFLFFKYIIVQSR